MEQQLIVTSGEKHVIECLVSLGISFATRALAVGDMAVGDTYLVERKTVPDLLASFKDGRYADQKERLCRVRDETGCQIVYIIEGGMQNDQVRGAIFSLQANANFIVYQTAGVRQTAEVLQYLCNRSEQKSKRGPSTVPQAISDLKLRPGDKLLKEQWLAHAIAIMPSLSEASGRAVQREYPSMKHLLHMLENCSEEEGVGRLSALKPNKRCLGKKQAAMIRECVLFGTTPLESTSTDQR